MDNFISEEIQRIQLLSKYDNSKTLSEQELDEYTYQTGNIKQPAGQTAQQLQQLGVQKQVQKPTVPIPIQLKDINGVKAFQDWLDVNVKGWATGYKNGIINKGQNGGGYGKYGPRTQKAWKQYQSKYLNQNAPQSIEGKLNPLPVQTQEPQQTQAPTQQQVNVTSGQAPTSGEELTLQGNPKSAFTR